MLFLPVGGHIKFREKHLARVLHAREEIDDVVLFLVHSFLLLHAVGNALRLEDIAQKDLAISMWYLIGAEFFSFASFATPMSCLMLYHLPLKSEA